MTDKFGYDISFMDEVQSTPSKSLNDIDVNIMGVNATIVDFSFLNTALITIRPWIQGFIYLLLALYHVNSVYKLLRGTNLVDIRNTISNVK